MTKAKKTKESKSKREKMVQTQEPSELTVVTDNSSNKLRERVLPQLLVELWNAMVSDRTLADDDDMELAWESTLEEIKIYFSEDMLEDDVDAEEDVASDDSYVAEAPQPQPAIESPGTNWDDMMAAKLNPRYDRANFTANQQAQAQNTEINPRYGRTTTIVKAVQKKRPKATFPALSGAAGAQQGAEQRRQKILQELQGKDPNRKINPRYERREPGKPKAPPAPPVPQQAARTAQDRRASAFAQAYHQEDPDFKTQKEKPVSISQELDNPTTIKAWCLENKSKARKLGTILVLNMASSEEIVRAKIDAEDELKGDAEVNKIFAWASQNRGQATTLIMQLIPMLQS